MRWLILILALLFIPSLAAAQSLDDAVTGGYSAVASRYQFGSTGGDWPVPANAPAPVVDCRGDFRSGACGATTFTPSGSPALASTYWRPGGGATAGSGVAFDGVDDVLSSPTPDMTGSFTVCTQATFSVLPLDRVVISEWGSTAEQKGWYLENVNGAAIFGTAAFSALAASSVAAGATSVICAAYENGTTNTIRINANGIASSNTSATAITESTADLVIGLSVGGNRFTGSISRVTIWSGWAASAADLARMVRSQYAAQGSLGEPLTVTRASSKSCSIGGQWFTVPSNTPCIGDAGLSVEGSRTQYALNNCTTPADQTVTLAAGAHTLWLEGTGTVAAAVGTATATGLPCTATAATACSFTISVGGTVTLDVTGTVDRMQVENGARSSLICATTTPVTRAADQVTTPNTIAAGVGWCVRAAVDPGSRAWNQSGNAYIASTPTVGAANSWALRDTVFSVYDAAAAGKSVTYTATDAAHVVHACASASGALSVFVDGALASGSAAGTGSGIAVAQLTPITIGAHSVSYTTLNWNGSASSLTTCNTANPQECQ